jgi:hypothetical protein
LALQIGGLLLNIEDLLTLILPLLLLALVSIVPLLFACSLFWFCSSSLLWRSLSDLHYFLNSLYNSCIESGFSLAK